MLITGCGPSPNVSHSSSAPRQDSHAAAEPPPPLLRATDDPRTILAKIVEAYGGKENLPRWDKGKLRYRAWYEKAGADPVGGIEAVIVEVFDLPGKLKCTVQPPPGQPGSSFTYVLDGGGGWIVQGGEKKPLPADPHRRNQDSQHRFGRLCNIRFLLGERAKASVLSEEEVNGRPTVGLSITVPLQPAFKAYFDAANGFLLKLVKPKTVIGRPDQTEATVYFNDYRQVGKTSVPMRLQGEDPELGRMDVTLLSIEFLPMIDDNEFAEP